MKRSLLIAASILAVAVPAFADGISTSVVNSGSLNNTVTATSSVKGAPGTSYSSATGGGTVVSNGAVGGSTGADCVTSINTSGTLGTTSYGTAYNISTGAGVGTATSVVDASAAVTATSKFSSPSQSLSSSASGYVQSGHSIVAGTNEGVSAAGATTGNWTSGGTVGAVVTGNSTSVVGTLFDNKAATSNATIGNVVIAGTDKTLTVPANTTSVANAQVVVNGSVSDPQAR